MTGDSQRIDLPRLNLPRLAPRSSGATSSAWVKGVIDLLERRALDVDLLLSRAGIDKALLDAPDVRIETEKLSRLWRLAAEMSGDDALGLKFFAMPKPANFDIVSYAMLSSANLRSALGAFARYLRLVSDAARVPMTDLDGGALRIGLEIDGGGEAPPRQRVEFAMATFFTFCKWLTGANLHPRAVFMAYPAPPDPALYETVFGCAVTFDAGVNAVDLDGAVLDAPLPGHNPAIESVNRDMISQRLQHIDRSDLVRRVEQAIGEGLVHGVPRRQDIARALAVSDRTLQRRLQERGLSFQKIVDDTRRDLAQRLLAEPRLSNAEIAHRLGFAEQSVFFRACRRWFNLPPGGVRRRQTPD
ncbi:AraC family transcriptional regulator [Rhodoblastus sp.]|uniref:AraC family transcriptional regulator n=1 Tax=Rhodoblastus sp. TaxID=1962975 RepID=UPI0035B31D3B